MTTAGGVKGQAETFTLSLGTLQNAFVTAALKFCSEISMYRNGDQGQSEAHTEGSSWKSCQTHPKELQGLFHSTLIPAMQ